MARDEDNIPVDTSDKRVDAAFMRQTDSNMKVVRPIFVLGDSEDVDAIAAVDLNNKALVVETADHYRIHQGEGYTVSRRVAGIARNDGTLDVFFKANPGAYAHIRAVAIESKHGPVEVDWYKGTEVSNDGTAFLIRNNKDSSGNTPNLGVYHTPTITDIGTKDEEGYMSVGGKHEGIGDGNIEAEYNINPGTNRLMRLTIKDGSGGTATVMVRIFFYEG